MFTVLLVLLQGFWSAQGFAAVRRQHWRPGQATLESSKPHPHKSGDSSGFYYNHVTLFLSEIPSTSTASGDCAVASSQQQRGRRNWDDQFESLGDTLALTYTKWRSYWREPSIPKIVRCSPASWLGAHARSGTRRERMIAVLEPEEDAEDTATASTMTQPNAATSTTTTTSSTNISSRSLALFDKTCQVVPNIWWILPMTLCLVPPFCLVVLRRPAQTPPVWKMVELDHLATAPYGAAVVCVFLLSNICYFAAAAHLLQQSRQANLKSCSISLPEKQAKVREQQPTQKPRQNRRTLGRFSMVPSSFPVLKAGAVLPSFSTRRLTALASSSSLTWSPDTGMGLWMLAAALMSTIFHSVQALGDSVLAEALCYLDHGVAGTSTFYIWHVRGRPKRKALVLGVIAVALLCSSAGYEWLHSAWHAVSACTACVWAQQEAPPS